MREKIAGIIRKILVPAGILLSFYAGAEDGLCAWEISGAEIADTALGCREDGGYAFREEVRKEYGKEINAAEEARLAELELEKEVNLALEKNNRLLEEELEKVHNCEANIEAAETGFFRMGTEEYSRKIYGMDIRIDAVLNGGGKKEEKEPAAEEKRIGLKKELSLPGICIRKEAEVNIYEQYMYIRGVTGGRGLEGRDIV